MNNKEFRTEIAKEILNLHKNKNLSLENINFLSWVDESLLESARDQILNNFYENIEELQHRPWYNEALETHEMQRQAFLRKKHLLAEKERIEKELEESILEIKSTDMIHLWKEHLFWDIDAILQDLKDSSVKIEKSVRTFKNFREWEEDQVLVWKVISINLPKVWKFKWFKTEYFIPDDCDFWRGDDYFSKGITYEAIGKIQHEIYNSLDALKEYLFEFWIEIDSGIYHWYEEHEFRDQHSTYNTKWIAYLGIITGINYKKYHNLCPPPYSWGASNWYWKIL